MKIELEMIQLRKDESLFLAGSNLKDKITNSAVSKDNRGVTSLTYDTETQLATVVCKNRVAHVKDWFAIIPVQDVKAAKIQTHTSHAQSTSVPGKAQIGGPKDVFTAQVETPITKPKMVGARKPKYQGQEPGA